MKRSRRTSSGLIAALTLLVLGGVARSEDFAPVDTNTYSLKQLKVQTDRLQSLLDMVATDLKSVMTASELQEVSRVKVRALTNEAFECLQVGGKPEQRVIEVSIGFVNTTLLFVDASIMAAALGRLAALETYPDSLMNDFAEDERRIARRQDRKKPLTFCTHIGIGEDQAFNLRNQLSGPYSVGLFSTLAVVLGHEYGHLILERDEHGRERANITEAQCELEADTFAFELLARLYDKYQYKVVGALSPYTALLQVELRKSLVRQAGKRALRAGCAAIQQCNNDPKFLKNMAQLGKTNEWQTVVKTLEAMCRQLDGR